MVEAGYAGDYFILDSRFCGNDPGKSGLVNLFEKKKKYEVK